MVILNQFLADKQTSELIISREYLVRYSVTFKDCQNYTEVQGHWYAQGLNRREKYTVQDKPLPQDHKGNPMHVDLSLLYSLRFSQSRCGVTAQSRGGATPLA